MPAFRDLSGRTFGRLTVGERIANIQGRTAWRCQCECSGTKETTGDALQSGKTRSCGCLWDDTMIRHGGYKDAVYSVWRSMLARCRNPKDRKWMRYGGRGINVDEKWESYPAFRDDMGPRPDGFTLERLCNDSDYGPANCVWASRSDQCRNSSQTRLITFGGATKSLIEWCEIMNLPRAIVATRLSSGWSVEDALTTAKGALIPRVKTRPRFRSVLSFDGKTMTIKEWSDHTGINPALIAMRIGRGWSPDRALSTPRILKSVATPAPPD